MAAVATVATASIALTQGSEEATAQGRGMSMHQAVRMPAHQVKRSPALTQLRKAAAVKRPATNTGAMSIADRLAPNNAWKIRADNAPGLASDSGEQVANLVRQVQDSLGGRAHINAYHYNTSIVVAPANAPRVRVGFSNCQNSNFTGDMYSGRKIFENVPLPNDAVPTGGTDGELSLYDPSTNTLWEFWQLEHNGDGWRACWGGRIDNVSQNRGYFQATEGASASGMAIAGGAITVADVERGRIDHAMNLGIRETAGWQRWTWPAVRADGTPRDGSGKLMQGQRLRLDPRVDVTKLGLNRLGTMIAKAAQEYGFIITDSSAQVAVSTESGDRIKSRTGKNPWDTLLGADPWQVLNGFPWDKMQALPPAYGK